MWVCFESSKRENIIQYNIILYYNVGTSVVSTVHNVITHITSVNRLEFGIYYYTLGILYNIVRVNLITQTKRFGYLAANI